MKVPPKRKGNARGVYPCGTSFGDPSMKVPPKRKGNVVAVCVKVEKIGALNESPSEKEGKSGTRLTAAVNP